MINERELDKLELDKLESDKLESDKFETEREDYIIRGTAADGQIRCFAVTSKNMVEEARQRHGTSPVMTAALGRLMSAGAMMGAMMKGEKDLLTLQIRGDGPGGGLTVTADAFGNVKGYPINPRVILPANSMGKLDVGGAMGKGVLTVIQDIGLKEPYSGQVELVSGEIAQDLTYYFAASEQTPSSVALGVLMNKNNTVSQAGGYILQLMPGTDDEVITALEEKLQEISPVTTLLSGGMMPEDILEHILGDFSFQISGEKVGARFHCSCSKERVSKVLVSLGKKELKKMIQDCEPVEVNCHFCNQSYVFSIDEMEDLCESM